MKIKITLKQILVIILILALGAGAYIVRKRMRAAKDPQKLYLKNKLEIAESYLYQGFNNPEDPKYFDYAIQQYEEILKLQPEQKQALLGLAEAYTQKGAFDKAESIFKNLIFNDPRNSSYAAALGFHYLARSMSDKAIEQADLAASYDPKNSRAYLLKALVRERQGEFAEAISLYRKSIELSLVTGKPTQGPYAYIRLGNLFGKLGLVYDAVQQYESVTRLWPKYPEGYLELANFYMRANLTDKSIAILKELLTFQKSDFRVYNLLGMAHLLKNDFEAAYAYFKKAQALGANINSELLENLEKQIKQMKTTPIGEGNKNGAAQKNN